MPGHAVDEHEATACNIPPPKPGTLHIFIVPLPDSSRDCFITGVKLGKQESDCVTRMPVAFRQKKFDQTSVSTSQSL